MPNGLKLNIYRILSFFLAAYILSFSFGVTEYPASVIKFGCIGSEETENLLEMVLEVDLDGYPLLSGKSGDCEKEAESESLTDTIDIFSHSQQNLSLLNYFHFSALNPHALCGHFNSRAQEINSPPPKC